MIREFFLKVAPYVQNPPSVLLMSGEETDCSRYCIAAWDPFIVIRSKGLHASIWNKGDTSKLTPYEAFLYIDHIIEQVSKKTPLYEDPFIGGFIGYISYEYKNMIEPNLPQSALDDLGLPDMFFIFPSKVLIFDKKKLN